MSDCTYFAYPSSDAHALFARIWGEESERLPVVCLPGLTRSSTDFAAVAQVLADRGRRVIGFDFRGRGGSAYAPFSTYSIPQEAEDTLEGLARLGISRALFLGTSRGGLVMMHLAATQPDVLAACAFNDIGPVIETKGIARITGYVGKAPPTTWPELIAELKAGQGALFPKLDAAGWERYARQIYADDNGTPRLAYDPAMAEAFKEFDPNQPLPEFWPAFEALSGKPVLAIHGALSDVLSTRTVEEMSSRLRGLEIYTVDNQGHAPLLWDKRCTRVVADFFDRANPKT